MKKYCIYVSAFIFGFPAFVNAQNKFKTGIPKNGTNKPTFTAEVIECKDKTITQGRIWMDLNGQTAIYSIRKTGDFQYWIENNSVLNTKKQTGFSPITEDNLVIQSFVGKLKPSTFGFKTAISYTLNKKRVENGNTVYVLNQTINNYPIFNATAIVGLKNNIVSYFVGKIEPVNSVDDKNIIPIETAKEKAIDYTKAKQVVFTELSTLLPYENEMELGVFKIGENNYTLAYSYTFHPNNLNHIHVIVDAKSGEILKWQDETCEIDGPKTQVAADLNNVNQTVGTYEKGGVTFLIDASKSMFDLSSSAMPGNPSGAIWTLNADNTYLEDLKQCNNIDGSILRKDAVSAQNNASICYDYFKNTFNRQGIDGNGGTIISVINCTDNNGNQMDNAFWNGSIMAYGNGANVFKPLAGSLDVGGHEMTHGVVQQTANLVYENQSGALNESFADIFGCMIDRANWQLGETIVKSGFGNSALRDLSDPHNNKSSLGQNGYQPRHMNEFYKGTDDNGGVHINSGIANWAYYKFATAITKEKAEKVYYRALSLYLNSSSEFLDCRYAVVKAAEDLHGTGSNEVNAAKTAFDEVGIFDPNGNGGGGGTGNDLTVFDLPKNLGDKEILLTNTSTSSSNQIVSFNNATQQFNVISNTTPKHMPSVTDNGSRAVFINPSNNIQNASLYSPYNNSEIETSGIWEEVAISKTGSMIAGISNQKDTSIYVYNFNLQKWKKFKLYNPTFTQGLDAGGVKYADVLEFNHSGEYIMYDQLTEIEVNGSPIEYWDIGIIKVWDLETNTWGDGKVNKLFNQLDKDESVGNPSYSRNSPHVIVFDYIKEVDNTYSAIGMNTSNGNLGFIASFQNPGRPTFNVWDEYALFQDGSISNTDVYYRVLNPDKITSVTNSSSTELISTAKWGYEYAQGTRRLLNNENDLLTFSFPALPVPVSCNINGTSISCTVASNTDRKALTATFTNSAVSTVKVSNVLQTSGTNINNFENPVVYSVKSQDNTIKNYTVTVTLGPNSIYKINKNSLPLQILPNPNKGEFNIGNKQGTLFIYDFAGKLVKEIEVKNGIVKAGLNPGNYIVKLNYNAVLYQNKLTVY